MDPVHGNQAGNFNIAFAVALGVGSLLVINLGLAPKLAAEMSTQVVRGPVDTRPPIDGQAGSVGAIDTQVDDAPTAPEQEVPVAPEPTPEPEAAPADGESGAQAEVEVGEAAAKEEAPADGEAAAEGGAPTEGEAEAPAEAVPEEAKPEQKAEVPEKTEKLEPASAERPELKAVRFGHSDWKLTSRARAYLDKVAGMMKKDPEARLKIHGHADKSGTKPVNREISSARAKAVADYLVKVGVARNRLKTVAIGEKKPINRGHGPSAMAENRRVELSWW